MKKVLFLSFLFLALIVTACNLPLKISQEQLDAIYEETMIAQINMIASMTPPTETPTITPTATEYIEPTATQTPTPEATPTWAQHDAGSAEVFVLYYNNIAASNADDPYYQWESDLFVPPVEFEQQVRMLKELGYTSITISQLANVLRKGGPLPERPVMFTFESTELGEYRNAYPILKKYGFVGNLFVQYYHIDAKQSLSLDQIQEMMDDGWEIGCSGYYGNGMNDLNVEIGQSKPAIEKKIGKEVIAFSYPDGYIDPSSEYINRVGKYQYLLAFAGDLRSTNMKYSSCYYLPRYLIRKGMDYNSFLDIIPWKEGQISQETMEWTLPTKTLEPEILQMTIDASEAELTE